MTISESVESCCVFVAVSLRKTKFKLRKLLFTFCKMLKIRREDLKVVFQSLLLD